MCVDRSSASTAHTGRAGDTPAVEEPGQIVRRFVEAYSAGDRAGMESVLSASLVAYITNAEAGVDRVDGAGAYVARLPDLRGAELSLRVTQSVAVAADRELTMVEVRARRLDRDLHNFAAFLSRVRDGRIEELWMVDALPADSAEFWS
jgi:ketosteroid isomerase-like protein